MRIRDHGINIGSMKTGKLNKISDVKGVLVGHSTIADERHNTGATVIIPGDGNPFTDKFIAASAVFNGFGKTQGLVQLTELGSLETPIALTNTLNVGIVHDAVVEYMIKNHSSEEEPILSVNPIVGECNDSHLNDIQNRAVKKENVFEAFGNACEDFAEGAVGAGRGMVCYGLKGGIGSASRVITFDGREFTVGALVLANHGRNHDLMIKGHAIGEEISELQKARNEKDQGSIIMLLATDVPLSSRQLGRVVRRAEVGLVRTGSFIGHGSGDIGIAFTTAGRINSKKNFGEFEYLSEDHIEYVFRAASEAVEESILNALSAASNDVYYGDKHYDALSVYSDLLDKCR